MGLYATVTSFSLLLPSYLKGDTTTVDETGRAILNTHITRAEALVNGMIGTRYALPFLAGAVPPILKMLTEDITCYMAMRGSLNQDGKQKNQYLSDFESAIGVVKLIASGDVALIMTDGSQVPANPTNRFLSNTKEWTPVFGLDDAVEWSRDPDEVLDTLANRAEQ